MLTTAVFLFLGVVSGAVSGLFGLGGGIVVVPMLVYLFGVGSTIQALVISSIVVVFASLGALASYEWSYLESRLKKMTTLLLPAFLAAFFGGAAHHMIARTTVSLALTALLHSLLLLAICVFTEGRDPESTGSYRNGTSPIAGAIIGFVSGLAAVGGGTYTITYAVKVAQQTWRDARMAAQAMGLIVGLGGTAGFLASY
ncbi:MAG: sulfite exporter TauE/SafE family protein, partial [Xanthobacteraceae bacterium]|nr:sulfite exporter TauE/SafE family protein [Xanthobacteraceae bacterium]